MRQSKMYWATGIVGLLLFIAPWVLGYASNAAAYWSDLVLGAAMVVFSIIKGAVHDASTWEYWVIGILGILAILASFVLGFATTATALWASIILGVIALVLAAIPAFSHAEARAS